MLKSVFSCFSIKLYIIFIGYLIEWHAVTFQSFLLKLFRVTADGNCLYNSCAVLLTGREKLSEKLRAVVSLELCLNSEYYAKHPYIAQKSKEHPMKHPNYFFDIALSVDPNTKESKFEQWKRTVVKEGINNSINNKWASLMCMFALSSVIKRGIRTVYPKTGGVLESVFNGEISP